jgi:hypothetical protein
VRYNLGTWLLTLLVAAAWLQGEGLALLGPHVKDAWQRNTLVKRLTSGIDDLAGILGIQDPGGPGKAPAHRAVRIS